MAEWGRCFLCGKVRLGEHLVLGVLEGREIDVCVPCTSWFGGMPDVLDGVLDRYAAALSKEKRRRLEARVGALKAGSYPEREWIRRWATLAMSDFSSFKADLDTLPLADRLLVLMEACGLQGFAVAAVVMGWARGLDGFPPPRADRNEKALAFLVREGLPEGDAADIVFGRMRSYAAARERIRSRIAEAERRRQEAAEKWKARSGLLGALLAEVPGWDPGAVEPLLREVCTWAERRESVKWRADLSGRARRLLAALDAGEPAAARKALAAYAGRRDLSVWVSEVAGIGWKCFAGPEVRKELRDRKRREEAEAARAVRLAAERETVKALRFRLTEMGVQEPLGLERLRRLVRMLPEGAAKALVLRYPYGLFGFGNREREWASEPPDPDVLAAQRQAVPDDVLLRAWNDRWVTVATAAGELGVSPERIRQVMDCLETVECRNPHYRSAAPMRLIRLSSLLDWAEAHRDLVARWAEASRRSKEAWRRAFERKVEELRGMPGRILAASDGPAPLVCFWLSLLNRAAKSGHPELYRPKVRALRALVGAGVPFRLGYVAGGDREERVWLCDACRERAREMGMHPLDYVELVGACENCDVEPRQVGYYDLYELVFSFAGVGKFCYHVPREVGRGWLPEPEGIPDGAWRSRGEEEGFVFGRALNRVEREAFTLEEIRLGLAAALDELAAWRRGKSAGSA